ncbi:unnamed protein product [Meloidogyne enterolobii]|uniref:Uncharacterized protein n=1 Tax=Meloidogyne enterolobii TaxID=390850 RepID=A0ACB0Z8P0_MELEN
MNFSSEKPPASVDAVIEQIQSLAGRFKSSKSRSSRGTNSNTF